MVERKTIRPVRVTGQRYRGELPDTLDLAERARLAINVLTRAVVPEYFYAIWQVMDVGSNPPHFAWPNWLTPKWVEALPRMRQMCGDTLNLDVERAMMQALVDRIGADGLVYHPPTSPDQPPDTASPAGCGRMMLAMAAWYERDRDPGWLDLIRAMGHGLDEIAIRRFHYAYYPLESGYSPDGRWTFTQIGRGRVEYYPYTPPDEPSREQQGQEGTVKYDMAVPIRGLVRGYRLTGDERLLSTARLLGSFCRLPGLWEDGWEYGVAGPEHGLFAGHFHGNVMALRGLLDLALATHDEKLKGIVREAYDHALKAGLARVGWFPCRITPERFGREQPIWSKTASETCGIVDMLALAVALSDAGIGDYWDDVDHFVRNQLTEQQLVDVDRLQAISAYAQATLPKSEVAPAGSVAMVGQEISADLGATDAVIERTVGGFGQGRPVGIVPLGIGATLGGIGQLAAYGCCTGNGPMGLYYAWEGALRFRDGLATVNLLLNRASPWLDVESSLPYEGLVRLRNKMATSVAVRVPGWVNIEQVQLSSDGAPVNPERVGRCLRVGELRPGQTVELRFALPQEQVSYIAHYQTYTFTFRGSTVLDVGPRPDSPLVYPFYQRQHIEAGPAPTVVREHYVAD